MIRKKAEYEEAMALRKRGFSYEEIAKLTRVSKSTIFLWLSDESWSKSITKSNTARAARENKKRITLLNKARSNQNEKLYQEAERSAKTEYKHYKANPLFIAGLMLYVSEGDNAQKNQIRVTSSQSEIHRVFIRFAKEFLGVPKAKFRFWVLLYSDLPVEKSLKYWVKETGLSITQFHRHQVIEGRSKKRTLHFGVGNTIIGDTLLKRKLSTWIALALKDLVKK